MANRDEQKERDELTPALSAVPADGALSRESNKSPTKDSFPWRILIVLYFVIISDGMSMQIIGPFLSQLCVDRWGIKLENVGFAAGFLFGAYSFAAFLTSFLIGYLSDLIGRKKLMLIGLCSAAFCTLGVVMVPNYWMAVCLRFIAGSTNSNVALSRAVIADVTKGENRVLGFAYLGAAFSFSRLVASLIGGLAAGYDLPFGLLEGNPYALPSFIGTLFNASSFIMAVLFIPETLSQAQKANAKKNPTKLVEGVKYIAGDSILRNLILGFALNSVTNGSLILSLYIYYTLPLDKHSLGFSPAAMGLTFGWFGAVALGFQSLLFERILKRLKIVRLYGLGLSVMCISTLFVPTGGLIYWWFGRTPVTEVFAYLHTIVCYVGLAVGFMTCLPVMGTMISNAADADRQGLTQGTNQSLSALFRAIGPFVAGAIFSFSVSISFPFLLFWFLGAVNLACLGLLRALPPHGILRVSEERPSPHEMQQLAHKSENGSKNGSERHAEGETESEPVLEVIRDEDQNNDGNHKERN